MARREKKVYSLDAETDPFSYGAILKPFVWGLKCVDDYAYFWGDDCTEQLIEYLSDMQDIILYAHNGGKFDFFFLLPYLDPEIFIINGRISKSTLFGGQIELRDSWLILPMPLSSHDKGDIDYDKMKRENREDNKEEILDYLCRDCNSLFGWVSHFREEFGGGLTLAGSAFTQLRKTSYPVERTNDYFDSYFRPYYYGGRVQCFETGQFVVEDLGYFDIKSAYPYAMLHPHWQSDSFKEKSRLSDSENGSYFATITARSRGALPYRFDNKLYFPDDGKIRQYNASGWEIIAGLETGTLDIVKVHSVAEPTYLADFSEYVNRFYKMKLDAELNMSGCEYGSTDYKHWATMRQFAKFMLNACYGKFGQDGRKFEKFLLVDFGDVPDLGGHDWSFYAESEFMKSVYSRPDPSNYFFNVATAASITSFVRAYLWTHICATDRPIYCDTDSIIGSGFHGQLGSELGQWEKEATIEEAYIAQRKTYALKTDDPNPKKRYKVASKGVKLTYDQIKHGVLTGKNLETRKIAPAFSLKYGARYFTKEIDFKNIKKNAGNNPPEGDSISMF